MKKLLLFFVMMVFLSPPAQAAARKPFTIVGLWDVTATIQGVFIHHTIDLREGGGQESLYMSKGGEHGNSTMNITWNYENKTLARFDKDGNVAHGAVEIISRTKIAITHGEDGFPQLRGMTFIYKLNEHQNEGGCQLKTPTRDQTIDRAVAIERKRRRSLPA